MPRNSKPTTDQRCADVRGLILIESKCKAKISQLPERKQQRSKLGSFAGSGIRVRDTQRRLLLHVSEAFSPRPQVIDMPESVRQRRNGVKCYTLPAPGRVRFRPI